MTPELTRLLADLRAVLAAATRRQTFARALGRSEAAADSPPAEWRMCLFADQTEVDNLLARLDAALRGTP